MTSLVELQDRVADGRARVAVVGQGYVGLSVAAEAALAGMPVRGIDTDRSRIAGLTAGRCVVPGVRESTFALAVESGRLRFTTDAAAVGHADVVLICVPTPVREHRPDLSYVEGAAGSIAPHLRPGTLVILESSTYPGTTEDLLVPILESGGRRVGEDLLVAYSPERIDPGNEKYDFRSIPRLVAGVTPQAGEVAAAFYGHLVDRVQRMSSCRSAELAKLLENTFRLVNIALVNELAVVCAEQGIDAWEVVDGAATKPFGFMPFYPGPGVGGHCIPLDPEYLTWQSRLATGRRFRLVEQAQEINTEMPGYVAARIGEALNDHGKAVRGAHVLALGVTYKPDVGDVRESASMRVLERLARRGARISFHDPYVDQISIAGTPIPRSDLDEDLLASCDCIALLTPHSAYELEWLADRSPLLFDAQNATKGLPFPTVVRL